MHANHYNSCHKNIFIVSVLTSILVAYLGIYSIANITEIQWDITIKILIFTLLSLYYLYALEKLTKNFGLTLLSYFVLIPILSYIKYSYLIIIIFLLFLSYPQFYKKISSIKIIIYDFHSTIKLITLLIIAGICGFIIYSSTSFGYGDFYISLRLKTFALSRDTLYHISLSKMWQNYGVFSTAIHGLTLVKGHFFSHLLYANIASILKIDIIHLYGQATWILFGPLFFYSLLKASYIFINPSKFLHFIFIFITLVLFLNYFVGNAPALFIKELFGGLWGYLFIESLMISYILMMGFMDFVLKLKKISFINYFILIFYLLLITFTKIFTGAINAVFICCIILFSWETSLFKRLMYICGVGVYWFLLFQLWYSSDVFKSVIKITNYNLLLFFSNYSKAFIYIFYEFISFWIILLFLLLFKYFKSISKAQIANLISILLSMLIGYFMLGLFIGAGILWYFADVAKFLCLPLIYALFFKGFTEWNKHFWFKIITMFLIIINIIFIPMQIYRRLNIINKFYNTLLSNLVDNPNVYLEKLHQLNNVSKNYLIYIPAAEQEYWDKACEDSPLYIPTITGRPALFGHPKDCYDQSYGYGFFLTNLYATQRAQRKILDTNSLCEETIKLGFKGYIYITKHKIVTQDCFEKISR